MEHISETKKSDVTMKGKCLIPNTNDSSKVPAEFLDENGDWKKLTWREQAMLTDGQLYAYERYWMSVVDERILREAAIKKGYNEGWEKGMEKGSIDIAKKMKQKGLAPELIAEMTGLSIDVLELL